MEQLANYDVDVQLKAIGGVSRDDLEAVAERIYDAISGDMKLVALGPAVSVNFTDLTVDLLCTVQAASPEMAHERAGAITALAQRTAETFTFERSLTTRAPADGLALAC